MLNCENKIINIGEVRQLLQFILYVTSVKQISVFELSIKIREYLILAKQTVYYVLRLKDPFCIKR